MSLKNVIGIDIATSCSCVSIYRNGVYEVIANEHGNRTTPSMVAFCGNERLIGDAAKQAANSNPKNTIYGYKRFMGRKFSEQVVQYDIKHMPYNVVKGDNDQILIQVDYQNDTKHFKPEEISAMVIKKMKDIAETYLGEKVDGAVVTVPAYFNDSQRTATHDACIIAGVNVIRMINEPTAAAIAYGLDKKGESTILIYDLGAGTLDISILNVADGLFEVLSTNGNTSCGGNNIDQILVTYCFAEFCKKNKIAKEDAAKLLENSKAKRRLNTECERAKKTLSVAMSTSINVDSFYDGIDLEVHLTRAKLEELCTDIWKMCIAPMDRVLADAKKTKNDIDNIVLVGGSSRIPMIQKMLRDYFNKDVCCDINPDEAIAMGASLYASVLAGNKSTSNELVLLDIIPFSVGLEISGGIFHKLIPRNTPKPVTKEETFSTFADNQRAVTVKIYEGERKLTKDNNLLGEFDLEGIPPMPRGVPKIKIQYSIDVNGILNVTASEESTGTSKKITITSNKGRMSKEEIDQKIAEAEKFAEEDRKIVERVAARNQMENTIYNAKNSLDSTELKQKLSQDNQKKINDLLKEYTLWIEDEGEDASAEDIKNKEKELQQQIMPIFSSIYHEEIPTAQFDDQSNNNHNKNNRNEDLD